MAGEHGLVALGIFFLVRVFFGVLVALDIGWQWQVAKLVHQLPGRLVVGALQRKAEQRTAFIGPAAQQYSVKAAVFHAAAQMNACTGQGLFADLHVGHDFIALQHALDQQFQLAAAGFLAKDTGLDHLGVVEDEQVAFMQQIGQILEDAVHQFRGARVEQTRGTAFSSRVLGNQVLGEHKVKIAEGMRSAVARRHESS